MKKLIFYIVALIVLTFSCSIYFSKTSITEIKNASKVEIETIGDAEKLLESVINRKIENKFGQINKSNTIETNFENMTINSLSKYYFKSLYKDTFQIMRGQKIINAFFTENSSYYKVNFYYIYEQEYDLTNIPVLKLDTYVRKVYKMFDLDFELYLTKEKIFLKFNRFLIIDYKYNKGIGGKETKNLFNDSNLNLYKDKWIDFTENQDILAILSQVQDLNCEFLKAVYQNITNYIKGEENFQKHKKQYILLDEEFSEILNSTSIKNIVEPSYLKDDLLGNLIIDFKNKNLNIDFLLECDIEKSIDEEILSIIGQEENKIEIVDINKTVINDLKENEICDYEDVKFIFEKLNFRGEK